MEKLNEKVVLVTGASFGIRYETYKQLVGKGMLVVVLI